LSDNYEGIPAKPFAELNVLLILSNTSVIVTISQNERAYRMELEFVERRVRARY
jgi:hypothetical protein